MTTARTLRRDQKKRDIRTAKASNAKAAIGTLTPGCEIFDGELPSLSSEDTAPSRLKAGRIDTGRLRVARASQ